MTVTVSINGTNLLPQPREITWESQSVGRYLDGTNALGSYQKVTLTAPPSRGGTATFNWGDYENSVLTSIVLPAKGQTMISGSGTTYNSGVVSEPITILGKQGDIQETAMVVWVSV